MGNTRRLTVLIAQDDPRSLAQYAAALEKDDIAVMPARTAKQALETAADLPLDAALIDSPLPDMEPAALCSKLKNTDLQRGIPVIALIGRDAQNGAPEPFDIRFDDCLARPFHLLELRMRVKTAARIGRALRMTREVRRREIAEMEADPSALAAEETAVYERPSLKGAMLGGCRLLEPIGSSKKMDVYQGFHLVLGVKVSVKLMPAAIGEWSPRELERFIRGARVAAHIDHPNIAAVLNAGREGDFYYTIRRYVEGKPLSEIIRESAPLNEERTLEIVRQIARGLSAAHSAGVIHRDVKPANIIIADSGEAKLIDFGLARTLGKDDISSTGEIVGTPFYMSPEQSDGEMLDARTDIYSLGAVFYCMVTGRPPLRADSLLELLRKQIYEEPKPPAELNPALSERSARIIMKMIAKQKAERYPSADALLDELDSSVSS